MKALLIFPALALAACTPTEMASIASDECRVIGYASGTIQHIQCTERGYRNMDAQQDAAIEALAVWALLEAAY